MQRVISKGQGTGRHYGNTRPSKLASTSSPSPSRSSPGPCPAARLGIKRTWLFFPFFFLSLSLCSLAAFCAFVSNALLLVVLESCQFIEEPEAPALGIYMSSSSRIFVTSFYTLLFANEMHALLWASAAAVVCASYLTDTRARVARWNGECARGRMGEQGKSPIQDILCSASRPFNVEFSIAICFFFLAESCLRSGFV